jgi:hypothetical protein
MTIDLSFLRAAGETEGPAKYIRNRIFVATRSAADGPAAFAPPRAPRLAPAVGPDPLGPRAPGWAWAR